MCGTTGTVSKTVESEIEDTRGCPVVLDAEVGTVCAQRRRTHLTAVKTHNGEGRGTGTARKKPLSTGSPHHHCQPPSAPSSTHPRIPLVGTSGSRGRRWCLDMYCGGGVAQRWWCRRAEEAAAGCPAWWRTKEKGRGGGGGRRGIGRGGGGHAEERESTVGLLHPLTCSLPLLLVVDHRRRQSRDEGGR
jgi:hypothetical protein